MCLHISSRALAVSFARSDVHQITAVCVISLILERTPFVPRIPTALSDLNSGCVCFYYAGAWTIARAGVFINEYPRYTMGEVLSPHAWHGLSRPHGHTIVSCPPESFSITSSKFARRWKSSRMRSREVLLTVARSVSVCTPNVECGSACTLANMVASGGGRPLWAHGIPTFTRRKAGKEPVVV